MTTAILETQTHLARCADCDFSVRYQPSSSGAGFTLLDSDAALGIGDNGRPVCPEGHGEMELADDRLPAAEAIAHAAEQLDARSSGSRSRSLRTTTRACWPHSSTSGTKSRSSKSASRIARKR
jgi:hypothetical protein